MPLSGGTSSGAPGGVSGNTQFNNAGSFAGMSGTTWDDTNRALTVTGATVTTSNPILNLSQTWNAGAVTFNALTLNVTDTASAAASNLLRLQRGGTDQFTFGKTGTASFAVWEPIVGLTGFGMSYGAGAGSNGLQNSAGSKFWHLCETTGAGFEFANTVALRWHNTNVSGTNNIDVGIARNAAGILEVNNGTAGAFRDMRVRLMRTEPVTVATLVAAATAGAGARSFVTDSNSTTFAAVVAGGGANGVPVYSDGTNWRIG